MAWRRTSRWVGTTQILLWSPLLLSLLKEIVIDIHICIYIYIIVCMYLYTYWNDQMPWTFNIRTVIAQKGTQNRDSPGIHDAHVVGIPGKQHDWDMENHSSASIDGWGMTAIKSYCSRPGRAQEVVNSSIYINALSITNSNVNDFWDCMVWGMVISIHFVSFPSNVAFSKEKVPKTRVTGEF